MSTARQILNRMINELPEDMLSEIITYIAFVKNAKTQSTKKNVLFKELEQASISSMDFWDNPIDDEVWNDI